MDYFVWLYGEDPFGLAYKLQSKKNDLNTPIDLQNFRPDPRDYIEKNKIYSASISFDTNCDLKCKNLRRIAIDIPNKGLVLFTSIM